MPCLAKGYSSCLPIGSKESNGCQPHLDSTIYLATSSIHGERHSGPCCSSTKHQGRPELDAFAVGGLWLQKWSLRLSCSSAGMPFAALQDEASACAELDAAPRMAASSLAFLFWRQFLVGHLLWHVRISFFLSLDILFCQRLGNLRKGEVLQLPP